MSLHVKSTAQAQQQLKEARRRSLLSSWIICLLTFILLTLVFITIKWAMPEKPGIPINIIPWGQREVPEPPQPSLDSSPSPSAPVIQGKTGEFNIPPPDINIKEKGDTPSRTSGIPSPTGNLPNYKEPSSLPAGIPGERCSPEDRLKRISDSGGTPEYETAVMNGLRWLMGKQNTDGSWGAANKSAMTGLALLAYLAHCETPYSEEFGESCQNAITFLINVGRKNKGALSETPTNKYFPYQHAIATYALAEASVFCKSFNIPIEGLDEAVLNAGKIIASSQYQDGSWMYFYQTREISGAYPDLSITGWNVQAMKALSHTGLLPETNRVMRKAEQFVKKMCDTRSGLFSYKPGTPRPSMSSVGVLSLQMLGQAHARETREGLKFIERAIRPEFNDPYTYYYASQALMNRGGEIWDSFGQKMGNVIVQKQNKDGSWPAGTVSMIVSNTGKDEQEIYRTCLNILTLEVYYRFLPATGEKSAVGLSSSK